MKPLFVLNLNRAVPRGVSSCHDCWRLRSASPTSMSLSSSLRAAMTLYFLGSRTLSFATPATIGAAHEQNAHVNASLSNVPDAHSDACQGIEGEIFDYDVDIVLYHERLVGGAH